MNQFFWHWQPKVIEYAMEIWKYDGTLILDTLLGMLLGIANRYVQGGAPVRWFILA